MAWEVEDKKRRRFQPGRVIFLVLLLWIGFNFARNAWDNYNLRQQVSSLEKRLVVLELRGEELRKEIAEWQLPENIERVAREELGLVKPGEVMYILSEPLTAEVDRDVKKR